MLPRAAVENHSQKKSCSMSLELCRRSKLSSAQVASLEAALASFYQAPPPSYYQLADEAARHYNSSEQPFHWDLLNLISPGSTIVELGCGTAHLCPHVSQRGGNYTGFDHSDGLLEDNRQRFPKARFVKVGTPLQETFDLVASLYTIEHVADPLAYLEQMWRFCRPGGLLAIICPEFVDSSCLPPSLYYGRTCRRLKEKLQSFSVLDAGLHLFDLKVRGPLWCKRASRAVPGAFWINLRPRILHGADYTTDADAVHLVRLRDLVFFFEQKGARIVRTSRTMPGISPEILRFNCYLVAQKPTELSSAHAGSPLPSTERGPG
jgi:SAM-dependent methyltransferase